MVADFAFCEKTNWVRHLKTIFALGGRNLKRPIIKSSNAGGVAEGGRVMLKFEVRRRNVSMLEGFPAKVRWHNISNWPCEGPKLFCFVIDVDHPQLRHNCDIKLFEMIGLTMWQTYLPSFDKIIASFINSYMGCFEKLFGFGSVQFSFFNKYFKKSIGNISGHPLRVSLH